MTGVTLARKPKRTTQVLPASRKTEAGWRWAPTVPPECQRHKRVPHLAHGMAQVTPLWGQACSGEQNPFPLYGLPTHNSTSALRHTPTPRTVRSTGWSVASVAYTQRRTVSPQSQRWVQSRQKRKGGQPGEAGIPRTTQCRRCRRQVLHPTHSVERLAIGETWSAGQNLSGRFDDQQYILCENTSRGGRYGNTYRWQVIRQQNGGQPWANGVSYSIQRRQYWRGVLDPDYSGDRTSPMRMLSGDQNPPRLWTVGTQNSCGTGPPCGHSTLADRSVGTQSPQGEVAR